jgi:methionine sulfoxide reductase heme-binding subunit
MPLVEALNRALRRLPTWPIYLLAAVPAAALLLRAMQDRLGADPVKALEHELGLPALQFLLATLAVTPLREATGVNLLRFRRMLGLSAFFYASLHFAVWLGLDRQLDWPAIAADLVKRPFILVGFSAFLLLVPLAATSFDGAIRRLGGRTWRRLHRLAYPAVALAAAHFVWLVKAWPLEPLVYASLVLLLLGWRVLPARARRLAKA